MVKPSYYQVPASPRKRKSGLYYVFIFIATMLIIAIGFDLVIKYQDFQSIYQASLWPSQARDLDSEDSKILLINLAYPDAGRIEAKKVTGLSLLSSDKGKIEAQILNPDVYIRTDEPINFNDPSFVNRLMEEVRNVLGIKLAYYVIFDFENLPTLFEQQPDLELVFSQDYQVGQHSFEAGKSVTMTSRLLQQALIKDPNESQETYGKRQLDLISGSLGNWITSIFSRDFTKLSSNLYQNCRTNLPFKPWLSFSLSQLMNNHFEINTFK